MTFEELLNEDYPSGDAWVVEPNYRWAVKGLVGEDEPKAMINRARNR